MEGELLIIERQGGLGGGVGSVQLVEGRGEQGGM